MWSHKLLTLKSSKFKYSLLFYYTVFLFVIVIVQSSSLSVPNTNTKDSDKEKVSSSLQFTIDEGRNESDVDNFPSGFFEGEAETTPEESSPEKEQNFEVDLDNSTESASAKPLLDCKCGKRSWFLGVDSLEGFINDKINPKQVSELIVGGNSTFRGEFPWLAALLKINPYANSSPRVICGATLINSRFLLTAAHCINRQIKERLTVAFNAYKITSAEDVRKDPEVITVAIKRLIPHAKFNIKTVDNDVGLIELAEPLDLVKLSDKIRPVCLPTDPENKYVDSIGTVAGWGYTRPAGVSSPELRKAEIPIIAHEKCNKTAYGHKILGSMLCAGYDEGGIDACTNDSGGPLTISDDEKRNVLVGVVSWGHSCAKPKLPGVYARVGNYLKWIQQHARKGDYCMQ